MVKYQKVTARRIKLQYKRYCADIFRIKDNNGKFLDMIMNDKLINLSIESNIIIIMNKLIEAFYI